MVISAAVYANLRQILVSYILDLILAASLIITTYHFVLGAIHIVELHSISLHSHDLL